MEINRVFIFITMAVVFFAMSSAVPSAKVQEFEDFKLYSIACISNDECDPTNKCEDGECVSPCTSDSCGAHALCFDRNHEAVCECPFQYTGDPYIGCKLMDVEDIHKKILEHYGVQALENHKAQCRFAINWEGKVF